MEKRPLTIIIVSLAILSGFFIINSFVGGDRLSDEKNHDTDATISSFEECVEAGYPVMESYPEQCRTSDGKHFVRTLSEEELVEVSTPIEVIGEFVCLLHWDTSGPVTMECAFGLLGDDGNYYALKDIDPIASFPSVGSRVEITGTLIPGSHEKYKSIGTIEVESFKEL